MDEQNIFGCYFNNSVDSSWSESRINQAFELGETFRKYLWDSGGFANIIKPIEYSKYGKDIERILFQFYINPIPELYAQLEEIEPYRKKEKSIGIPIVLNDDNFFKKGIEVRNKFLKETVLKKLDLLKEIITKKKLDTNIELLKSDFEHEFD
jgi:hypothetical protein